MSCPIFWLHLVGVCIRGSANCFLKNRSAINPILLFCFIIYFVYINLSHVPSLPIRCNIYFCVVKRPQYKLLFLHFFMYFIIFLSYMFFDKIKYQLSSVCTYVREHKVYIFRKAILFKICGIYLGLTLNMILVSKMHRSREKWNAMNYVVLST